MKKQYTKPEVDVVAFSASDVIATSEDIAVGDTYETGSTEAPRRGGVIWDED